MTTPVETVQDFYAAIASGDTEKMVKLMAADIEWISVVDFDVQHRGPEEVMKKVLCLLCKSGRASRRLPRSSMHKDQQWFRSADLHVYNERRTNVPTFLTPTCGMSRTGRSNGIVSTSTL